MSETQTETHNVTDSHSVSVNLEQGSVTMTDTHSVSDTRTTTLTDEQRAWVHEFCGIDPRGKNVSGAPNSAGPQKAVPASPATSAGQGQKPAAASDGHLPSPMLLDCKIVHGKVRGPENHVLCSVHGHVVDTETKMIIAHSVDEYMKQHPASKSAAKPNEAGKAAPAPHEPPPAAAAGPKATDQPTTPPAANEIKTIPIPHFSGPDKDVFAQTVAVLDTMKPSSDRPDIYTAVLGGQQVVISKANGDALRARVSKLMTDSITTIAQYNHTVMTSYDQARAKGTEKIGATLEKPISWITGHGWIRDPGDDLEDLEHQWLARLTQARADLAVLQFVAAANCMAAGEILGLQAEHLMEVWTQKVQGAGGATLSVLTFVKNTAFSVDKALATATFGPAGAAAVDGLETAAEISGDALAGHKINWSEKVIDLGTKLLLDKFGGQAEAAVKGQIEGVITKKLEGTLGKKAAEKLGEKIAGKVASKVVSKGSDILKDEMNATAEKLKGKDIKYSDLVEAAVTSLGAPTGAIAAKILAEAESDPEYKSAAGR
jgi:hypothetical protein